MSQSWATKEAAPFPQGDPHTFLRMVLGHSNLKQWVWVSEGRTSLRGSGGSFEESSWVPLCAQAVSSWSQGVLLSEVPCDASESEEVAKRRGYRTCVRLAKALRTK